MTDQRPLRTAPWRKIIWSMSPRAIIREALRALIRNKLRSTLTVLGITIGIGAVICVVAIGQAGSAQVEEQLNNLGDNFVWIEAGSRAPSGIRTGSHGTKTLLQSDVEAIIKQVPLIKLASANVDSRTQIVYGNKNWCTGYRGVAPEYFQIKRWGMSLGAPFTQADVDRASDVCVIGETVRQQLFDVEDPIGKVIRVRYASLPGHGRAGCPWTNRLRPRPGRHHHHALYDGAEKAEGHLMARRYRVLRRFSPRPSILPSSRSARCCATAITSGAARMMTSTSSRPDEFINTQLEARRTFSFLLISIASVSLLVGGIGIMNVMLVRSPNAPARSASACPSGPPMATSPSSSWAKPSCQPVRRIVGRRFRGGRFLPCRTRPAMAHGDSAASHRDRRAVCRRRRRVFRLLSRPQSLQARPHRSPPLRIVI